VRNNDPGLLSIHHPTASLIVCKKERKKEMMDSRDQPNSRETREYESCDLPPVSSEQGDM
jgi:hypothetical protein